MPINLHPTIKATPSRERTFLTLRRLFASYATPATDKERALLERLK